MNGQEWLDFEHINNDYNTATFGGSAGLSDEEYSAGYIKLNQITPGVEGLSWDDVSLALGCLGALGK